MLSADPPPPHDLEVQHRDRVEHRPQDQGDYRRDRQSTQSARSRVAPTTARRASRAASKLIGSNKIIAKDLRISEATVKTHLLHIFAKRGVDDRTAAVTAAMEKGVLRLAQ